MPIYAYKCESCGHRRDVLQKISDPVLSTCPACGAVSNQAKRPSMAPSSHDSTHTVMASGVHTSSPARRYFFTPLPI